ncbi:hypothetical protein Hanom_Chr08g00738461 [Helianthus anomalus]
MSVRWYDSRKDSSSAFLEKGSVKHVYHQMLELWSPLLTISTHGFGWKFMSLSNLTHTKLKKEDQFFNIRHIRSMVFCKKKKKH